MTSYSYVKEPSLQESGYTRGLKTGSFNYLAEGKINFNENITYSCGNGSAEGNSSVKHELDLEFNGTKGISEFYGKGFFKNNRAISAWKKIRYDDLTYNFSKSTGKEYNIINLSSVYRRKSDVSSFAYSEEGNPNNRDDGSYKLGRSYNSTEIKVDAIVTMDTTPRRRGGPYAFTYNASVKDGIIEAKDATGWTNKTGSRRIDMESDLLLRGNISIVNVLKDTSVLIPAAGSKGDWLPCCFDGTHPEIEVQSSGWPNEGTYATLKPDKELPDGCNETNNTECKGYECVFTYQEGQVATNILTDDEPEPEEQEPIEALTFAEHMYQVTGNNTVGGKNVTYVTYLITVENLGDISVEDVFVNDTLPPRMHYDQKTSSLFVITTLTDGQENMTEVPLIVNSTLTSGDTTERIRWSLGSINTNQVMEIRLHVYHYSDEATNYQANKVDARGISKGREIRNTMPVPIATKGNFT